MVKNNGRCSSSHLRRHLHCSSVPARFSRAAVTLTKRLIVAALVQVVSPVTIRLVRMLRVLPSEDHLLGSSRLKPLWITPLLLESRSSVSLYSSPHAGMLAYCPISICMPTADDALKLTPLSMSESPCKAINHFAVYVLPLPF